MIPIYLRTCLRARFPVHRPEIEGRSHRMAVSGCQMFEFFGPGDDRIPVDLFERASAVLAIKFLADFSNLPLSGGFRDNRFGHMQTSFQIFVADLGASHSNEASSGCAMVSKLWPVTAIPAKLTRAIDDHGR